MRQPILVLTGVVLFMGGCGRTVPRSPAQPTEPAPASAPTPPPPQTTPSPSP
jgi:hypothetical protein